MAKLFTKFVTMRFPLEIYEKLKARAIANTRSVSAEILHIVKEALG